MCAHLSVAWNCAHTKTQPNLKLKIMPKELLGCLPLAFTFLALAYAPTASATKKSFFSALTPGYVSDDVATPSEDHQRDPQLLDVVDAGPVPLDAQVKAACGPVIQLYPAIPDNRPNKLCVRP
jgi:hypothetical protein